VRVNPTPWAALYRHAIAAAAKIYRLDPLVLLALVDQESNGGVRATAGGRWSWHPGNLYRYEPGFWDRYLAGKPEWTPPGSHPAIVEAHKRRVSASYGPAQVMYPTAVELGHTGAPEALFDPVLSIGFGAGLLRRKLDGPAKGDVRAALAAYNTGRARPELTTYDDEVLGRLAKIRAYAATGADLFGG
jgi:soluble lytic murein transglycosylase-like protein